jgi:hypothetical protein
LPHDYFDATLPDFMFIEEVNQIAALTEFGDDVKVFPVLEDLI